ncbi:Urb2/Npa2 family-domain-containing protein [Zopfochytrium polystomum]|nr:Urb2/Npa2 family-domain-containing protein [Zopfochytrium polystomum]
MRMDLGADEKCIEIVSKIFQGYRELSLLSSLRASPTYQKWVPKCWKTILDYISPIAYISPTELLESLLDEVLKSLENLSSNGSDQKSVMATISAKLLQASSFYELQPIKGSTQFAFFESNRNTAAMFPTRLLNRIVTLTLEAFPSLPVDDPAFIVLQQSKAIFEDSTNQAGISALYIQLNKIWSSSNRRECSPTLHDPLARAALLLESANLLPATFFSGAQMECLTVVCIVSEVLVASEGETSSKLAFQLANLRTLLARFLIARDPVSLSNAFPFLRWLLSSAASYLRAAEDMNSPAFRSIRDSTLHMMCFVLSKLLQKLNRPQGHARRDEGPFSVDSLVQLLDEDELTSFGVSAALAFFQTVNGLLSSKSVDKWRRLLAGSELLASFVTRLESTISVSVHEVKDNLSGDILKGKVSSRVSDMLSLLGQLALYRQHIEANAANDSNALMVVSGQILFTLSEHLQTVIEERPYEFFGMTPTDSTGSLARLGSVFLVTVYNHLSPSWSTLEEKDVSVFARLCGLYLIAAWKKDPTVISSISQMVVSFCQESSATQYSDLLNFALEALQAGSSTCVDETIEEFDAVVSSNLFLLSQIVRGGLQAGRRGTLRRFLLTTISVLRGVLLSAATFDIAIQSLSLLTKLSEDKLLAMKATDVASIISCSSSLAAASHPLNKVARRSRVDYPPSHLGPENVFDAVCQLLLAIVMHRRDKLITCIAAFTGVLRGLLHCLREPFSTTQTKQRTSGRPKKSQSNEPSGSSAGAAQRADRQDSRGNSKGPLFSSNAYQFMRFASCNVEVQQSAAWALSRVLERLSQKEASALASGQDENDGEESNQANSGRRPHHQHRNKQQMRTATATSVQPLSKHASYVLAEYAAIQSSRWPLLAPAREALEEGMFALLDLGGEFGRGALLSGLEALQFPHVHGSSGGSETVGGAREIVKELVGRWEKQHVFKGKI